MTVNIKNLRTTSDVHAVPVQTVLLLRCADFKTGLIRPAIVKAGVRYSLVPFATGQHDYRFSNLGTDCSTVEGIQIPEG